MAQHLLIKGILFLCLFTTYAFANSKNSFECREVKIQSKSVNASELSGLCFLRDDTYFISQKCASMDCAFIERLKKVKISYSQEERPGMTMCKAIDGIVEQVTIPNSKVKISRCLFGTEKVFISLNLLESWNGKYFTGPSRPLKI
jgi:hypothetical protein